MRSANSSRVLVFGVIESLTFAVARCLAAAGLRPTVLGWHHVSPLALAPDCHYVASWEPCWVDDEINPALIDCVDHLCRQHGIMAVVPADYDCTLLLARHRARLTAAKPCALPSVPLLRALNDKWRFSTLLRGLDLPQPETQRIETREHLERTPLSFPLVTKPIIGWAGLGVQVHQTRAELESVLSEGRLAIGYPLLAQRYIPGRDVGFAFLARRGRLVAHTAFEALARGSRRHFDAPRLRANVAKLVAATGYHGVGEVDTRYDPERDEYRLLELNPRFWASLLYHLRAGMNFPALLLQLEALGDGPGCITRAERVSLGPYELAMKQATQLSERTHDLGARMLAKWRGLAAPPLEIGVAAAPALMREARQSESSEAEGRARATYAFEGSSGLPQRRPVKRPSDCAQSADHSSV
jgi:predicted ATP-grasp superfamily ATP-dependent carboligase